MAFLGIAEARTFLGCYYANDGSVEEQDTFKAVQLYRKTLESKEDPVAMCRLGYCFFHGTGVEKNMNEAFQWYRKAADLEETSAMFELGLCLLETGVDQNKEEAVSWYRKAAGLGDKPAMNDLGRCYANGTGVEQNVNEAVLWYRKAADLRDTTAMKLLWLCYNEETDKKQDADEVEQWYQRVAELEDATSTHNVAIKEQCPICYSVVHEETAKMPSLKCGHTRCPYQFHFECLTPSCMSSRSDKCPMCRKQWRGFPRPL